VVLHFETSAGYQNYTQTVSGSSSDWNGDVNAGLGTVVRMFSGTYVNVNANYTFDAEILPGFTAATEVVQKLSRRLDFLVLYRYLYDKNYEVARKESPVTHLFSTGVTFYASDNVYTQVQGYMEDNSKDLVYSFFLHQSFGISPRDWLDGYFSYGKGINHLVFPDKTVSVNVTTIGIAVAYTHFFPSGLGIKPSVGYHDRVDSYTDYTLGLEAIWKF
jgi:YaiO family outer membrane protein